MKTMTRLYIPALLAFSTLAQADMAFQIKDDGALVRPEGYREWVYVGTPVTPNDMNDGKAPSQSSMPSILIRRVLAIGKKPASTLTAPSW